MRGRDRDGLPTYVPPTALSPGASMISARPSTPESGRPAATDLAITIRSGSIPNCSMANVVPVRRSGLHLVGDEDDALLVTQLPRPWTNSRGGTTKPPSPCTGLEDDRCHVLGRDARLEGVLERVEVGERNAVGLRRERPSPALYGCVLEVRLSASRVRP